MAVDLTIDIACNNIIPIIDKMLGPDNREGLIRKVRYQEYKFPSLFIRCILFRDTDRVIIKLVPLNITGRNRIIPNIESYIENAYPNVEIKIGQVVSSSNPAFTIRAIQPYSLTVHDMNYSEELEGCIYDSNY